MVAQYSRRRGGSGWYRTDSERPHHKRRVWQSAKSLAIEMYRVTESLPADERFGLTSQLRRAAISVPSNIAEGAGRGSGKEFLRFLLIARGSLNEIDTQLEIAEELGFLADVDVSKLRKRYDTTSSQLQGLISRINARY